MAACDGRLSFRGDVLQCELPAGHDGPCKSGSLTFQRIAPPSWIGLQRQPERKTAPTEDAASVDLADECFCDRCRKPCGACKCPRVYRTSAAARQADAARRDTAKRVKGRREWLADKRASGICIGCPEPADPSRKDGRCGECGADAARRVWLGRQVRAILNDRAFNCQHGAEDPRTCKRCRKCVVSFVRENEPELRARVRRNRPAKVAAANAARDRWLRDFEAAASDEGSSFATASAAVGEAAVGEAPD